MEKLTLQQAIDIVEKIDSIKEDDESAHSMEDDLHTHFINCIANGCYDNLSELISVATEIDRTKYIEFSRWCA